MILHILLRFFSDGRALSGSHGKYKRLEQLREHLPDVIGGHSPVVRLQTLQKRPFKSFQETSGRFFFANLGIFWHSCLPSLSGKSASKESSQELNATSS